MGLMLAARPVLPGTAEGRILRLTKPISFWGGIDPATGRITDPRHPQHGAPVGGTLLAIPGTIGSSSSSAVLLELIAGGRAPAALILAAIDAILLLGAIVARELGLAPPPAVILPGDAQGLLPDGALARLDAAGGIAVPEAGPPRPNGLGRHLSPL